MEGSVKMARTKYQDIFEHCAVSLWEEDISRLRVRLEEMRSAPGFNLRAHLSAHPEFLQEAAGLIDVADVNQATLRLFEAESRQQLLGPLTTVPNAVLSTALAETILAIDDGRSDIETETPAVTLKGRSVFLLVKTHIPSAAAEYPHLTVSIIDITARRSEEQRERATAGIMHSIIDSSPDWIFVKDTSLRMVLCNTALSRAIGKEPQETYGKTDVENGWDVDIVKGNPEKGIQGWEKDDLSVLGGQTLEVKSEPASLDQGVRYYNTIKFPLRNAEGSVVGLVGIGRDVTERRQAEAELRKAKEFAENLINTANVLVLGLDLEGRVTIFNRTSEEITGFSRAEIVNRNWFDTMVPKERYPHVLSKFEKLTREGDVGAYENPIITKSGEERHISWQNSQILEGGRVVGTLSFGIDITERRRMQAELERERYFLSAIMGNLPDYIYIKDAESRFLRTSVSHARALGIPRPEEAVGKTDFDFYRGDHAQKAFDDEQRVIASGIPLVDMEERETYPDRPDTWALTTKVPLRDARGNIVGTFGITHDITQRKLLEEKNEQLAALVEFADDAIVGLDTNRRITVMEQGSGTGLRLYRRGNDLVADLDADPPELEEEARIIREKVMRGEQVEHFETTRLRKDGARITVVSHPVRHPGRIGQDHRDGLCCPRHHRAEGHGGKAQPGPAAGRPGHPGRGSGPPVQQHQYGREGIPGSPHHGEAASGTAVRVRGGGFKERAEGGGHH